MTTFSMRVIVADDHPFVLLGAQHLLASNSHIKLVGTASNSTELIQLLRTNECDVLVTDYAMPGGTFGDGPVLLKYLRNNYPNLRIVVNTMVDNPLILNQIKEIGVCAILNKADDSSHLIPALHVAYSKGNYYSPSFVAMMNSMELNKFDRAKDLSKRELEVLRQFASGRSVGEIAEILNRSKQTISTQKNNAMKKLGIERDADLYKFFAESGL